ncbi:MAG TPA: hypothetical protein PKA95_08480 [Thermomicrobiales bacterium]|nr:hypothetical protein [Thermomicrobiales bacterium]
MTEIPRSVLLSELRRYANQCEADAQRARVIADEAWRQWRQALDDEREDALIVGEQQWHERVTRSRQRIDEILGARR